MIIQYSSDGRVDLKSPIYVEEEYFNRIVEFLKRLKGDVKIQEVTEVGRFDNPNKDEKHPKRWEASELLLLLDPSIPVKELMKKFERSEGSIMMQKSQFVPSFISWCKKKGYTKPDKKFIEQYLEEKHGNNS